MLKLAPECKCEKCSHGCSFGSGYLFEKEAEKIASYLNIQKHEFKEKFLETIEIFNTKAYRFRLLRKNGMPYGKCVFFRQGLCSINNVKPLHCRISSGCKGHGEQASLWFMMNYFVNPNDSESLKQYEEYLSLGGKTIKGGDLKQIK